MSTPTRHRDERKHYSLYFEPTREDPTLVVCPACQSKAFVLPGQEGESTVDVVCHACGLAKTVDREMRRFEWYTDNPTDGYFGLDLWLETRCVGHAFWAFNRRHLSLLERYISATLRERKHDAQGWRNTSLTNRLPKWMTSRSNREEILTAIRSLRTQI